MANENFLETIARYVNQILQLAAGVVASVFDSLPSDWSDLAKLLVVIAIVAVSAKLFFAVFVFLVALPRKFVAQWWLLLRSAYGRSDWATWLDLRKAKLTGGKGMFLGQWRKWFLIRQDLFHFGQGHILTLSAPAGGKTSSVVVPVLLEAPKNNSFIVADPSGEVTAMTAEDQESKRKVFYLNPFYEDFKVATGLDYVDSGFNPFSFIANDHNIRNHSDNLAQYLCVTDRKSSQEYFASESKELLSLLIAWIVRYERKRNKNLAFLYVTLRSSLIATLKKIVDKNDPLLVYDARKYLQMSEVPAQWEGVVSKANLATKRYIPTTPMDIHTSKSNGFDPRILKQEDVTVYVLLPSHHLKSNESWINMVMGLLGDYIGRPGKERPVTLLLDELPALGFLPDLISQMRQHRKAGMRVWLFSQSVAALTHDDLYGEKGFGDMQGQCDIKQFFNTRDYQNSKAISDVVGKTTRINHSMNKNDEEATALAEVPLIPPENIRRLGRRWQIIIYFDASPIKCRLVPYFTRPEWNRRTNPNPYRG